MAEGKRQDLKWLVGVHMYVFITVSFSMWAQLCGHTDMHNESFGRRANANILTS